MVEELQQQHGVLSSSNTNHPNQTINQLNLDVGNSIICNHLQTHRYDYSLSVYLPECNMTQDKVIAIKVMLKDLCNIYVHTTLHQHAIHSIKSMSITSNISYCNTKIKLLGGTIRYITVRSNLYNATGSKLGMIMAANECIL